MAFFIGGFIGLAGLFLAAIFQPDWDEDPKDMKHPWLYGGGWFLFTVGATVLAIANWGTE